MYITLLFPVNISLHPLPSAPEVNFWTDALWLQLNVTPRIEDAFTHKGFSNRGAQSNSFIFSSRPTKHFKADAKII